MFVFLPCRVCPSCRAPHSVSSGCCPCTGKQRYVWTQSVRVSLTSEPGQWYQSCHRHRWTLSGPVDNTQNELNVTSRSRKGEELYRLLVSCNSASAVPPGDYRRYWSCFIYQVCKFHSKLEVITQLHILKLPRFWKWPPTWFNNNNLPFSK